MERSMIITDVTRMGPPRVCVAGFFTDDGSPVRPVLPFESMTEDFLYREGQQVVMPFAEVRMAFTEHCPDPPHTEDWEIDPFGAPELVRLLSVEERRELLRSQLDGSVAEIFGAPIHESRYLIRGHGDRSLGTIAPSQLSWVSYRWYEEGEGEGGKWDYRVRFIDEAGEEYAPKVTDLTFRTACDYLRTRRGWDPNRVSQWMRTFLSEKEVYFRIGLARAWEKYPDRCYLQVTGIYSFPDYLGGRTYADLREIAAE